MPFLPTPRLLALLAAAAALFLVGDTAGLAADACLLGLAAADALLAPRPGRIRVERRAPARLGLGAAGDVAWELENRTGRAVRVWVTDDLPPALAREGQDVLEATLEPWRRATVAYRVRAQARGPALLGDVHLRVAGPLGLVRRQLRATRADMVRVLPGLAELRRRRRLGAHPRPVDAGLRVVRQRADRGEFESLREYARGDDPRTIDWKATARRAAPIVRRYQAERSQNVLLAIDAGRLMTERIGDRERLDHALAAALLLADVAAAHGDRVGVLEFADRVARFAPPARVPLSRIAGWLGDVRPRLVEPNYPAAFATLARRLRRRSLVVLFTNVIDARVSAALIAHLGRAARRHLALVVAIRNPELDAAAIGAGDGDAYRRTAAEELLQARARALASMRRAGVHVVDARPDRAIPAAIDRYLRIKRQGLL